MIKIILVSEKYINYLFKFDNNVRYNKGESRPYIGILLEVNGNKYYAPLSSPKPKFLKMKNCEDFMRIDSGKLGAINFNNMIPLVDSAIIDIDINKCELKYKILLNKQLNFFKKKELEIIYKASKLYKAYKTKTLRSQVYIRCCNFLLLEKKSKHYDPNFILKKI